MIWREKRLLLLILALLLLGNIVFFFTYRVQYQSRLDAMDQRLAQAEAQLAKSKRSRAEAEAAIVAYRRVEQDVQTVFNEYWSTQPRRFTALIAEIKRLAEASNAVPKSYSYTREVTGGASRAGASVGATQVGISYSVQATYDQVRRMINLLELSQQFVIIQQIALTAGEGDQLTLTLRLKTLFREDAQPAGTDRL